MDRRELEELRKSYILSEIEHRKVLERIRKYTFDGKVSSDNPHIKFVLAQTGAGKSNLTASILRSDSNYVIIDSDKCKPFRDDAKEIAEKYPTDYGFLTWQDAYRHRDEIYEEATQKGYNIIIEIAPSIEKGIFFDISQLPSKYIVDFEVLAVSDLNSLLSTRERYELQIESGLLTPKLTDIPRHDESFQALRKIMEEKQYSYANKNVFLRGANTNRIPIQVYPKGFENGLEALIYWQNRDTRDI